MAIKQSQFPLTEGDVENEIYIPAIENGENVRLQWGGIVGLKQSVLPAGTLISSLASEAPDGWLLCNGQAVSRSTYKALYKIIGNRYGVNVGDDTFNLPNFQNHSFWGAGGVDAGVQVNVGDVLIGGLPNIVGTLSPIMNAAQYPQGTGALKTSSSYGGGIYGGGGNGPRQTVINFSASDSNPIYGSSDSVRPAAIAVNVFIKY